DDALVAASLEDSSTDGATDVDNESVELMSHRQGVVEDLLEPVLADGAGRPLVEPGRPRREVLEERDGASTADLEDVPDGPPEVRQSAANECCLVVPVLEGGGERAVG